MTPVASSFSMVGERGGRLFQLFPPILANASAWITTVNNERKAQMLVTWTRILRKKKKRQLSKNELSVVPRYNNVGLFNLLHGIFHLGGLKGLNHFQHGFYLSMWAMVRARKITVKTPYDIFFHHKPIKGRSVRLVKLIRLIAAFQASPAQYRKH